MSYFSKLRTQSPAKFKRETGLSLKKFKKLRKAVSIHIAQAKHKDALKRRGSKSELSLEHMLLLTLFYLRHYPTFLMLGQQFGISESYANKLFHRFCAMLVNLLRLPGRHSLQTETLTAVVVDVTEQPIERPQRGQRAYYSGKKKRHTIKAQLVVSLSTLMILSLRCEKGCVHDFKILKNSRLPLPPETLIIGDAGYQGMSKLHLNSQTPIKKKKGQLLTPEEKLYNRQLSRKRIVIEHINRRCKIFRIVKETYRGKHKNYGKIWNIIAGLVNLRYAA